jgi:hypothetical protein
MVVDPNIYASKYSSAAQRSCFTSGPHARRLGSSDERVKQWYATLKLSYEDNGFRYVGAVSCRA